MPRFGSPGIGRCACAEGDAGLDLSMTANIQSLHTNYLLLPPLASNDKARGHTGTCTQARARAPSLSLGMNKPYSLRHFLAHVFANGTELGLHLANAHMGTTRPAVSQGHLKYTCCHYEPSVHSRSRAACQLRRVLAGNTGPNANPHYRVVDHSPTTQRLAEAGYPF